MHIQMLRVPIQMFEALAQAKSYQSYNKTHQAVNKVTSFACTKQSVNTALVCKQIARPGH